MLCGTACKKQVCPVESQSWKVIRILAAEVLDVATTVNLAFAVGTAQANKIFHFIIGTVVNDLAALESLESDAQLLLARASEIVPVVIRVCPVSQAFWRSYGRSVE
jgi:hypothetical protein